MGIYKTKKILTIMLSLVILLTLALISFGSSDPMIGDDAVQLTKEEQKEKALAENKARSDYLADGGSTTDAEYRIMQEKFDGEVNTPKGAGESSTAVNNIKVSINTPETNRVKGIFSKYFSNEFEVVDLSGLQGKSRLRVKNYSDKLDVKNLVFYTYNSADNSYAVLENANYEIDSTGNLRFSCEKSGIIIISSGVISK